MPITPRASWFSRPTPRHDDAKGINSPRPSQYGRKTKKHLILSSSMVIDVDPKKVRAYTCVLQAGMLMLCGYSKAIRPSP